MFKLSGVHAFLCSGLMSDREFKPNDANKYLHNAQS